MHGGNESESTGDRSDGARLAPQVIEVLTGLGEELHLADGETLMEQGDEGNDLFLVTEGCLDVLVGGESTALQQCSDGDLVGEITSTVGGRRSATLRASGPVVVVRIASELMAERLAADRALADAVSALARTRLDLTQLAELLRPALGTGFHEGLRDLVERVTWRRVSAGDVVYEPGEVDHAAYVVVSGAVVIDPDDRVERHRAGRGELVGAAELLDREPRSHRAVASRATTLARLDAATFEELVAAHPGMMLRLFRSVLGGRMSGATSAGAVAPASVAVAVTAPVDRRVLCSQLLAEHRRHGPSVLVSPASVESALQSPGIARIPAHAPGSHRVADHLHELETTNLTVLYEIDDADDEWARRAVEQSGRVVVFASGDPSPDEVERLDRLRRRIGRAVSVDTSLVLVHPAGTTHPTRPDGVDTAGFDEVLHIRDRHAADIGRVARLSVGRGVGVVLGGGGARGFAHLGAMQALLECGVPVDRIGGASIGSVLAGFYAVGMTHPEVLEATERGFDKPLDYTVPVVALTKGQRIERLLGEAFGGWDIQDTWIPYSCTTTNITTADVHVHRSGSLTQAIRASVAIPGVIPPVPFGEDLHVDGGVLANLPVDVMADEASVGTVIALDVAPPVGTRARNDYGMSVSGWRALADLVTPGRSQYPALTGVLMRSMLIGSNRDRSRVLEAGHADLHLHLDARMVGLLEFETFHPVVAAGYDQSIERVRAWAVDRPDVCGEATCSS